MTELNGKCASSDGSVNIPDDADEVLYGELANLTKDLPIRINYLNSLVSKMTADLSGSMGKPTYSAGQTLGYWRGKVDAYQSVLRHLSPPEEGTSLDEVIAAAAERSKKVTEAKAAMNSAMDYDHEGLRRIRMEQLVDTIDSLSYTTLRDLLLNHIYQGGSFN